MLNKIVKFVLWSILISSLLAIGSQWGDTPFFMLLNRLFIVGIAFVPLMYFMSELGPFKAFFAAGFFGVLANIGLMYWVYPMNYASTNSHISSIIVLVTFSTYLALYYGVWGIMVRLVKFSSPYLNVLFAASLWVTLEYLHTYYLSGLPWPIVGAWAWKNMAVIQISEYTGIYGVSFLVLATSAGVVEYYRTRKLPMLISIIAVLVAVHVFGIARINKYKTPETPGFKISVLQSNVDQYKKWNKSYVGEIKSTFEALLKDAVKDNPDLIVWPETSVPGIIPAEKEVQVWLEGVVRKSKRFNMVSAPYKNDSEENYYNSAILMGPDAGTLKIHHKTQLVPFSEYIPFRAQLAPYLGLYNAMPDLTAGKIATVFEAGSVKFGTSLCTENFYGEMLCRTVKGGAQFLLCQTNDGWLMRSNGHLEHFMFNVFRAIENRRTLIVSCNTGLSGVVSPSGEMSQMQPLFENATFSVDVAPRYEITFFAKYGELFAKACIAFSLVLTVIAILIGLKKR